MSIFFFHSPSHFTFLYFSSYIVYICSIPFSDISCHLVSRRRVSSLIYFLFHFFFFSAYIVQSFFSPLIERKRREREKRRKRNTQKGRYQYRVSRRVNMLNGPLRRGLPHLIRKLIKLEGIVSSTFHDCIFHATLIMPIYVRSFFLSMPYFCLDSRVENLRIKKKTRPAIESPANMSITYCGRASTITGAKKAPTKKLWHNFVFFSVTTFVTSFLLRSIHLVFFFSLSFLSWFSKLIWKMSRIELGLRSICNIVNKWRQVFPLFEKKVRKKRSLIWKPKEKNRIENNKTFYCKFFTCNTEVRIISVQLHVFRNQEY